MIDQERHLTRVMYFKTHYDVLTRLPFTGDKVFISDHGENQRPSV